MNDLQSLVPASITIAFPDLSSGALAAAPFTETVTLTSLALPEYAGVPGHAGTKLLKSAAAYDGTNAAELLALAQQIANDWYLQRLGRQHVRFIGIDPYQIESINDHTEWVSRGSECSTWVRRGDHDISARLSHFSSAGSAVPDPSPPAGQEPPAWLVTNPSGQTSLALGLGLTVYGGGDFQGGIKTSPLGPLPAPVVTSITNPGTTLYTLVTTGVTNNNQETPPSLPLTITTGPNTTPSPTNVINLTQTLLTGITTVNVYQLTPLPVGLVVSVPVPVGTGTLSLPITTAPDPTRTPPTSDPTSTITTTSVNTTAISVTSLPPPPAPTVTPTTPSSSTVTVTVAFLIDGGTTVASTVTTITTAPATITTSNPLSITVTVPATFPPAQIPNTLVVVYITTPNTTSNPNGPVLAVPIPVGTLPGGTFLVPYLGTPVLPYYPVAPPATNTTGVADLPNLVGSTNIVPLATPAAPTVTPVTTGATTYTYGVTANDGQSNHTAIGPTTTITNGNATADNVITWLPVVGAVSYGVWRTAGGATQGQIATVTPDASGRLSYTDGAATADGATPPATNDTGQLTVNGVPVSTGGVPASAPQWQGPFTKTFSDFQALGAVNSGAIGLGYTLPAKGVISDARWELITPFTAAAPAVSAGQIGVGYGTTNDYIVNKQEAVAASSGSTHGLSGTGSDSACNSLTPSLAGSTTIQFILGGLTGNTANHLNAGSVTVWLLVSVLP